MSWKDILQSDTGTVNITAANSCAESNALEDIETSDVLETIELLLKYIKKRPTNKDKKVFSDLGCDWFKEGD